MKTASEIYEPVFRLIRMLSTAAPEELENLIVELAAAAETAYQEFLVLDEEMFGIQVPAEDVEEEDSDEDPEEDSDTSVWEDVPRANLRMIRQYWYNLKYRGEHDHFMGLDGDLDQERIGYRLRNDAAYEEKLTEKDREILYIHGGDLLYYCRDLSWTPTDEEVADAIAHFIEIMESRRQK